MGFLRRLTHAVVDVDWSAVALVAALRAAVLCVLVLTWAVTDDRVVQLLAAEIGILLVCVVDPPAPERRRVRTMAWFALWAGLAALVGGLASDSFVVLLVVGVVVALVSGYAGAAGPTGAVIGMLSLVVFSLFSSTPVALDATWRDPLVLVAGVALGGLVIMVPALRGRARCSRASFARLARGLAHTEIRDPRSANAALCATREREFAEMVAAERLAPAVEEWFAALGADAHRARLGMLGVAPRVADAPEAERDAVVALLRAACRCWGAAATAVTWPWRRRILVSARARLGAAYDALVAVSDPATQRVAAEVHDGLDGVVTALLAEWPTGARPPREASPPTHHLSATARALRAHLRIDDLFARHALRLAVTFGAAIALAEALDFPHPYWLPMTVAWIARPTMGDTSVRVTARVVGTAAGVVVSGAIVVGLDPGQWGLVVLIGVSAALAVAFLPANYAIAIAGITPFLFFLMVLGGEDIESSLASRLAATVIAGVLVLIAATVWPNRSGAGVDASLGDYADALAEYAGLVLQRNDLDPATRDRVHAGIIATRAQAAADLHAADFEVGHRRLHPETTHAVIESLHAATAYCLGCELAGPDPADVAAAPVVSVQLVELRSRLVSGDAGLAPASAPRPQPVTNEHPVHRSVRLAHEALDDEIARRARHASGKAPQHSSISRG